MAYINGMQSTGISACIKHFDANNEEQDRNTVDVRVSERALREIYLPSFKAGVERAHAFSVMASYNKVNGNYATSNHYLLTDILRNQWHFDGLLISDWSAIHDATSAAAGCNLEMPTGKFMTPKLLADALSAGTVTQEDVDEADRNILRTIIRTGLLDGLPPPDHSQVNSAEHQELAYQAACEAIVLLKNDHHTLPLDAGKIKSVAVIGPAAVNMQFGALGSPAVTPPFTITPMDAVNKLVGNGVTVNYAAGITLPGGEAVTIPADNLTAPGGAHGLLGEFFTQPGLQGPAGASRVDTQIQIGNKNPVPAAVNGTVASVRWGGMVLAPRTGLYRFVVMGGGPTRLTIDGKVIINAPHPQDWYRTGSIDLTAGQSYSILLEMADTGPHPYLHLGWIIPELDDIDPAVAAAANSDVALVFVTTGGQEGEGRDRPDITLPGRQDELIERVAAVNKHTIVIINAGSPVGVTPWLGKVSALVDAGFPGMEGGRAIADVLFGAVDPSGKLTDTVAASRSDYADFGNFPGVNNVVHYSEGIYVGYRHFDKAGIDPVFPFGYGLSYTRFKYGNLKLSSPTLSPDGALQATVDITNSGSREGAEVVELYLHDPNPEIDRPIRELKGFDKVDLQPGETKTVTFTIDPSAVAYYNVDAQRWQADSGDYDVEIGASSRDIKLSAPFTLTGLWTAEP